jgi:hypothetical protein
MTDQFEYFSDEEATRIAILENKAAELEQRLLAVTAPNSAGGWANVATPRPTRDRPRSGRRDFFADDPDALDDDAGDDGDDGRGGDAGRQRRGADNRTEELIKHGRRRTRRSGRRRLLAHWRLLAVVAVALTAGMVAGLLVMGGGGPGWPSSVATVQGEVKTACENQDVAAEPSGLNFACGADTQAVLWVFSLLTSGNNPGFVDSETGRKGLEPIVPAQGGDIAWSLNLHHPYDPGNPIDSLEVAARAINNIISGATLTSSAGGTDVEAGLESTAANCERYTGSAKLVTPPGYPAHCAAAVTSASGQAALVSDVFQQWMGGTPSQLATEAGVLFENASNPGNPKVQAILQSLPDSGQ